MARNETPNSGPGTDVTWPGLIVWILKWIDEHIGLKKALKIIVIVFFLVIFLGLFVIYINTTPGKMVSFYGINLFRKCKPGDAYFSNIYWCL